MKCRIEIDLDNAAFEDDEELPRILRDLAERVPAPIRSTNGDYSIHDANGNYVGHLRIQ